MKVFNYWELLFTPTCYFQNYRLFFFFFLIANVYNHMNIIEQLYCLKEDHGYNENSIFKQKKC